MRKKILVLLSIALVLSANLRAQVTIGSVNAPKAGAILDLNSGAKGGLILSNVSLDNIGEIPSGFPGMSGAEIAVAKAQLKGAMVYNTNPNTCVGVHAWNGNHWSRIISPRKSTGNPLSITSSEASMLGGDEIEFTVDCPGGKTFAWYLSRNNAPYEYLAVRTTPNFSMNFPAGSYKIKVISDNCHVLEESNEVSFTPESLSPNFGSTAGGNTVYLYGDFPYAATSEYEQGGLVAHYDGVNNTGQGDKMHDNKATGWTDLKFTNTIPLLGDPNGDGWQSAGYKIASTSTYFYQNSIPANFSTGSDDRTLEVIFKTPDNYPYAADKGLTSIPYMFDYGGPLSAGKHSGVAYNYNPGYNAFYPMVGYANAYSWGALFDFDARPLLIPLTEPSRLNTSSFVYTNSLVDIGTHAYLNGADITEYRDWGTLSLSTSSSGEFCIGNMTYNTNINPQEIAVGFTIHSIRIYNRTLTSSEIAHNAGLDQKRYLNLPKVKIDGKECTEVVVLSPNFLMCKVPASTNGTGLKDVEITTGGNTLILDDAYKYVHPVNDFYVSNISPIIGSAGDVLELTGNKLGTSDITGIKVGGNDCPIIPATQTSTYCECTLQDHPAGEVDITITTSSKTYRFAKVFEYK